MRNHLDTFHLAVPAYDLDAAETFYGLLGCKRARRYTDRVTFDFFGDQLVCHFSERPAGGDAPLQLYPRHFGVTFGEQRDFDAVLELCLLRKVPFFAEMSLRFEGLAEVHQTFVIRDPSDNLLEFKHYRDPRMMY